jgi:hypothetical protein
LNGNNILNLVYRYKPLNGEIVEVILIIPDAPESNPQPIDRQSFLKLSNLGTRGYCSWRLPAVGTGKRDPTANKIIYLW